MPPRHNVTEHQCVVWKSWFLPHVFLDPCHMLSERWTLLFLCVPLAENVNKITILVSIAFRNLFPGHNPKQFQQFLWKKIPSYHKDMQFGHGRSSRSVSKVKVNASLSLSIMTACLPVSLLSKLMISLVSFSMVVYVQHCAQRPGPPITCQMTTQNKNKRRKGWPTHLRRFLS